MLTIYDAQNGRLAKRDGQQAINDTTVWIDLLSPTPEEDRFTEQALGISVPTPAEMREIEASNRRYQEGGAYYMTAVVIHKADAPLPEYSPVTFILTGKRLVTVRTVDFRALPMFVAHGEKADPPIQSGCDVLIGLLEALVQRKADLIERIQDDMDRLARSIFDLKGGSQTRNRRLDVLLKGVGTGGELTARAQESATSLERALLFFQQASKERGEGDQLRERIESVQLDIKSLMDHMRFLSDRATFLLEATLGMISTEQNQIIKLFSVMAVMLMPPTLVASVYGMNFEYMPELKWLSGYPLALGLMVVSGVVPYIYFRRKGWL